MDYRKHFNNWQCDDTTEVRVKRIIYDPKKLDTTERIRYYDNTADSFIAECQTAIKYMQEYRQALASRYAELETMLYIERLELVRYKIWRNSPVTYRIRIIRTYEDGTTRNELDESYSGKDRRAAFDRFTKLKQQRPGIEAIQNTAKKSWEK